MEDILDVYEMPYDPWIPVVCMDEKPYQLLGEVREPLRMCSGDTQKIDSEYTRNGTVSICDDTPVSVTADRQYRETSPRTLSVGT